jgi:hypothetical protein
MEKAQNSIAALTSRRNFIKSGAAVIAALAVPAPANAKAGMARAAPEHPDRALFEAIAEWQGGHEEQERLSGIDSQLTDLAGETEPAMPSELFEALEMPNEKLLPGDMSVGWDEADLRAFVERGTHLRLSTEKLPNDALRTDLWWDDISQTTRQRARELLQVKLEHIEKVNAHWEKAREAEDRFSNQVQKQSDRMMAIAGMSVCTGEGLAAKCQMLLDEPMFGDYDGEAGFIANSLIADIRELVECGAFPA